MPISQLLYGVAGVAISFAAFYVFVIKKMAKAGSPFFKIGSVRLYQIFKNNALVDLCLN